MRAVHSLYERSQSLVRLASSTTESFLVRVGFHQGCSLSPILFITFMDRISRHSQGVKEDQFGNLRIRSLHFVNELVLLAPSVCDLQLSLNRFIVECAEDEH